MASRARWPLAHGAGLLFVTDTSDNAIKVFGSSAGGDTAPAFTAFAAAAPWDLAYDEPNDRLYATLANGTVAIFDDFVAMEPFLPTGTIVPSVDGLSPSAVDLRGIALVPRDGALGLVVSDFGAPGRRTDGVIYVFDDISMASGLTVADQRIRGATGQLRDPVDLAVSADGFLRVVDSGAQRLLVYPALGAGRFEGSPASVPRRSPPWPSPSEPAVPVVDFTPATDLDSPDAPILELVAATAPDGMNGEVLRLAADLASPPSAMFDPGLPVRGWASMSLVTSTRPSPRWEAPDPRGASGS